MRTFRSNRFVGSLAVMAALAAGSSLAAFPVLADEPPAEPPISDAASAPDENSASAIAIAQSHDVIVDEFTTDTTQVVATPDGLFQLTSTTVPVRTKVDNAWVDIDTNLALAESGYLEPAATTVPVQFSAGGGDEMARVQMTDGDWLTETWPLGDLPAPVVDGASATYEDVLPDVDLRLAATASGMSEVLIINSEAGANNPELADLTIAVDGASITKREDGTTLAGPDGTPVTDAADAGLQASTPTTWDSSDPNSGPDGAGGSDVATAVDSTVQDDSLTLDVTATLDDDSLVYPVYIDPDWNASITYWTIDQSYGTTAYPGGMDNTLPVGYLDPYNAKTGDGQYLRTRSFWSMNIAALHNKQIYAAHFNNTEVWAFSCTQTPVELWQTNAPANASWNDSIYTAYYLLIETKTISYGYTYSTCPDGRSAYGNLGWDVEVPVESAAVSTDPYIGTWFTLGMKAANESDNAGWKRFAQSATMVVTYNTTPNTPTAPVMTSPSRTCAPITAPSYIGVQPVTVQVTTSDPDAGATLQAQFFVKKSSDNSDVIAGSHHVDSSYTLPGAESVTIPAATFTPGVLYYWQAQAFDNTNPAGEPAVPSALSTKCYFSIISTTPSLPTTTGSTAGAIVGKPTIVQFHSDPAQHIARFAYWWVTGAPSSPRPAPPVLAGPTLPDCGTASGGVNYVCADPSTGDSAPVGVAPKDVGAAVLYVASYDGAGNLSRDTLSPINNSAAIIFPSAVADTASGSVTFGQGHGWMNLNTTTPTAYDDMNSNTGTGTTVGQQLIGVPVYVGGQPTYTFPNFAVADAVAAPGYLALSSYLLSGEHVDVIGGTNTSGYTFDRSNGWIMPPATTDPTGMNVLWHCNPGASDYLSTTSVGCISATKFGYTWVTSPDTSAVALKDCSRQGSGHFTTTGTTSCGNGNVQSVPLGFVITTPPVHTTAPVVDTTQSFTVGGMFYPTAVGSRTEVALSQSGTAANGSAGFFLKLSSSGLWQFCTREQTGGTATNKCASGPAAALNQWEAVFGVWDAVNHELRLYVGNSTTPRATLSRVPNPGDVTAGGSFVVGAALEYGAMTDQWSGKIAYPTIFPGVLTTVERNNLIDGDDPNFS